MLYFPSGHMDWLPRRCVHWAWIIEVVFIGRYSRDYSANWDILEVSLADMWNAQSALKAIKVSVPPSELIADAKW